MNRQCLFVVTALALVATPAVAQPVKSLALHPQQVTVLRGQRFQFSLVATTPQGTQFSPPARFVFRGGSMSSYGLATAHRPGKHTISVRYRNLTASATMTVVMPGQTVATPGKPAGTAAAGALELRNFEAKRVGNSYRVSFQAVSNNRQIRALRVLRIRPDGRAENVGIWGASASGRGMKRVVGVPAGYKAVEVQLIGSRNAVLGKVRRDLQPQPPKPQQPTTTAQKPKTAAVQVVSFNKTPRGSYFQISLTVRTVSPAAKIIRLFRVAPNGKRAGSLGGASAKVGGTFSRKFQLPRAAARFIEIEVYGAKNAVLQTERKQLW